MPYIDNLRLLQVSSAVAASIAQIEPQNRVEATAGFTDLGDEDRVPGELPAGQTLSASAVDINRHAVNLQPDKSWLDVLGRRRQPDKLRRPTILLDMNETVFHVPEALGLLRNFADHYA